MFGVGDVWTWAAIDADTKLMFGYRVDRRDEHVACHFLDDSCKRLASRVPLTTDGPRVYLTTVPQSSFPCIVNSLGKMTHYLSPCFYVEVRPIVLYFKAIQEL